MPPGKPKPAPSKAAEKKAPESSMLTTDETVAVLQKAQENNINALDIAAGVQKLIEMFPEFSRDDVLAAHNRLAEGFTIEQIKEAYEEGNE